ncbi:MAG: CpsD/CapB family tyrosine-protein kinase [Terriglobia bacterium]
MSRIHDALKKAEQDRVSPPPPEPAPISPEPFLAPVSATESATESGAERVSGDGLPLRSLREASPVSLEGWVAECPAVRWKPDPKSVLFSDSEIRQLGMEEFRTLRTHLLQMREKVPLQTLLITSVLPGEGKTFVAANLAQAFVQQRSRRVLLIDADLRISRLHGLLGAASVPGLSEFLKGEAEASSIIQRGTPENLFLIPGGRPASNPTELVGNGRLKNLLHRLAPLFDWIVVDSPPCVPLSDASLLADLCDGVLMVVRSGQTPYDIAQKGSQQFRERRLLGVVLNHVAPQSAYSAYYYQAPQQGKT